MPRPEALLASPEDLAIPQCVPGAEQAIAIVREHHAAWLRNAPR